MEVERKLGKTIKLERGKEYLTEDKNKLARAIRQLIRHEQGKVTAKLNDEEKLKFFAAVEDLQIFLLYLDPDVSSQGLGEACGTHIEKLQEIANNQSIPEIDTLIKAFNDFIEPRRITPAPYKMIVPNDPVTVIQVAMFDLKNFLSTDSCNDLVGKENTREWIKIIEKILSTYQGEKFFEEIGFFEQLFNTCNQGAASLKVDDAPHGSEAQKEKAGRLMAFEAIADYANTIIEANKRIPSPPNYGYRIRSSEAFHPYQLKAAIDAFIELSASIPVKDYPADLMTRLKDLSDLLTQPSPDLSSELSSLKITLEEISADKRFNAIDNEIVTLINVIRGYLDSNMTEKHKDTELLEFWVGQQSLDLFGKSASKKPKLQQYSQGNSTTVIFDKHRDVDVDDNTTNANEKTTDKLARLQQALGYILNDLKSIPDTSELTNALDCFQTNYAKDPISTVNNIIRIVNKLDEQVKEHLLEELYIAIMRFAIRDIYENILTAKSLPITEHKLTFDILFGDWLDKLGTILLLDDSQLPLEDAGIFYDINLQCTNHDEYQYIQKLAELIIHLNDELKRPSVLSRASYQLPSCHRPPKDWRVVTAAIDDFVRETLPFIVHTDELQISLSLLKTLSENDESFNAILQQVISLLGASKKNCVGNEITAINRLISQLEMFLPQPIPSQYEPIKTGYGTFNFNNSPETQRRLTPEQALRKKIQLWIEQSIYCGEFQELFNETQRIFITQFYEAASNDPRLPDHLAKAIDSLSKTTDIKVSKILGKMREYSAILTKPDNNTEVFSSAPNPQNPSAVNSTSKLILQSKSFMEHLEKLEKEHCSTSSDTAEAPVSEKLKQMRIYIAILQKFANKNSLTADDVLEINKLALKEIETKLPGLKIVINKFLENRRDSQVLQNSLSALIKSMPPEKKNIVADCIQKLNTQLQLFSWSENARDKIFTRAEFFSHYQLFLKSLDEVPNLDTALRDSLLELIKATIHVASRLEPETLQSLAKRRQVCRSDFFAPKQSSGSPKFSNPEELSWDKDTLSERISTQLGELIESEGFWKKFTSDKRSLLFTYQTMPLNNPEYMEALEGAIKALEGMGQQEKLLTQMIQLKNILIATDTEEELKTSSATASPMHL